MAVRDLAVQSRESDLVIATHGRGIWIIDDLTPLRAMSAEVLASGARFLPSRPVQQRMQGMGSWILGDDTYIGRNPTGGASIAYYLRSRHIYGPIKLEVFDDKGKLIDTIDAGKRRGINRVAWAMQHAPPRVPRAAQVAFGASSGPRVLPGTYTVRLTRGTEKIETKLKIGLDRRGQFKLADRKAQIAGVMKAHALFGDMSALVDRIDAAHDAAKERVAKIPNTEALNADLSALIARLEEIKKVIVATKEGGAITGEERIREHLEIVYSAMMGWDGRPTRYQLARVDALSRELGDVRKDFEAVVAKEVPAIDGALKKRGLEPIPTSGPVGGVADLDRAHGGKPVALGMRCLRAPWAWCDELDPENASRGEKD